MKGEIYELAMTRLGKAKKDLESSELNFSNKYYLQSINRSYSAIFQSARALLTFDDFESEKHSGIINYINKNYVKTKKIEKEYSEILFSAENLRLITDYNDFYIVTKQQAEAQLLNAKKFFERMKSYIKKNYT